MKNWQNHITINSEIRFGKPIVIGTRICDSDILSWLASGMTIKEVIIDFHELTKEDILATLWFASKREQITEILV